MALKFVTHFEWIAIALDPPGADTGLWDEEDGFYYDVMRMPDGSRDPAQGALARRPAAAVRGDRVRRRRDRRATPSSWSASTEFVGALLRRRAGAGPPARPEPRGPAHALARRRAAAAADPRGHARRGGVPRPARDPRDLPPPPRRSRACSTGAASATRSHYLPAESDTGMFGGNSNWRGPVWFPMNLVILRGLLQLHRYYGDRLTVECPTGSGREMNLLRGRDRDQPAPDHARSPRTSTGAGRCSAGIEKFQIRPALARPAALPRVLPRRQRRRHRRQPPDRVDRDRGAALPAHRRACGCSPGRPPASPTDRLAPCACLAARPSTRSTPRCGCSASAASAGRRSRSTRCPPPSGTRSRRCPSTPSG